MMTMKTKGEYSFSTCWIMKKHTVGRELIKEIRELGFSRVELNYNITREMLTTIEPIIERGEISISSVHNTFSPTPDPITARIPFCSGLRMRRSENVP